MSQITLMNRRQALTLGAASAALPFVDSSSLLNTAQAQAVTLDAPILTISSLTGLKPVFCLDLDLREGDVVEIDRAKNNTFSLDFNKTTVTFSGGAWTNIVNNGSTPLAGYAVTSGGQWYFRAIHKRGGVTSPVSLVVPQTFSGAATPAVTWSPPILRSAGYSANGLISFNNVSIPNPTNRKMLVWVMGYGDRGLDLQTVYINPVNAALNQWGYVFKRSYNPTNVQNGFSMAVCTVVEPWTAFTVSAQFGNTIAGRSPAVWSAGLLVMELQNSVLPTLQSAFKQGSLNQATSMTVSPAAVIPTSGAAVNVSFVRTSAANPTWSGLPSGTASPSNLLFGSGQGGVSVTVVPNASATNTSNLQPTTTYGAATSGMIVSAEIDNA
jgi:hypothetical protein